MYPTILQPFTDSPTRPTRTPRRRLELPRIAGLERPPGRSPALVMLWNQQAVGAAAVDVVVHFHGFAMCGQPPLMALPRDVEPRSGLVFNAPDASGPGRERPTIALLPRGTQQQSNPAAASALVQAQSDATRHYHFPSLITPTGLRRLIESGVGHFGAAAGGMPPQQRRLILTAHSGGGAALLAALKYIDPHEVHLFDALYRWPPTSYENLIQWVRLHVRRDQAALARRSPQTRRDYMHTEGGALRVLLGPRTKPAPSQAVARSIRAALTAAPDLGLDAWYRVEKTTREHCDIPVQYGWRLLADAAAPLPETTHVS